MPRPVIRIAMISALVVAGALSVPGDAHHSTAMFNWGKEIAMKNVVVTKWDWTNPHTFLYVEAPGAGGRPERWAFEGMSPNHLVRTGWSKRTLKAGDKVDITYYSLKDGRKGGFNVTVTFPDGKTIRQLGSPAETPAARPGS